MAAVTWLGLSMYDSNHWGMVGLSSAKGARMMSLLSVREPLEVSHEKYQAFEIA